MKICAQPILTLRGEFIGPDEVRNSAFHQRSALTLMGRYNRTSRLHLAK